MTVAVALGDDQYAAMLLPPELTVPAIAPDEFTARATPGSGMSTSPPPEVHVLPLPATSPLWMAVGLNVSSAITERESG